MRIGLLGTLALGLVTETMAQPPPVTAFTNFAEFESASVSPNGTYLAITRRDSSGETLTVLELPNLSLVSNTTFGELLDIERVEWANNERLLIQPMRRFPAFTAAKVPTGEIFGIDANGKRAETLFGYAAGETQTGTRLRQRQSIAAPARLLGSLPDDPDAVLIQTYGYDIEGTFNTAYRMDVISGLLSSVASSPIRDGTFVTDAEDRVVFVYGEDDAGNDVTYYRSPTGGDWKLIAGSEGGNAAMIPVGQWGPDGEFLVVDDHDAPTTGVFAYSPASDERRLLFRNSNVDIGGWSVDPNGTPWVFAYDDHYPAYWYPDPEHPLAAAHRWLLKALPGNRIDFTSSTSDLSHAVARLETARSPLAFVYVDVKNRKILNQLRSFEALEPAALAEVDAIEFKARDGLAIRGLLTVPNVPKKTALPMVVLVHGGPHGIYDTYGFDYEAQLFASRGYAVLQINFRGSGGRGRVFEEAGYGKWGAQMQDDITDGVRWAIGDGVADPQRICIYGGSYGAYAALTGAFREPDLFRCAVGMAGVYDLPLMFERGDVRTVESGLNYLEATLGTNTAELERRSPVFNAARIRAAVMLVHGEDDERAPLVHAERMRDALVEAGNPPEWLTAWGEGHGLLAEENRAAAYTRILEFFGKHLASASAAAAP